MTLKRIAMKAKYNSVCRGCYEPIAAGDDIVIYLDKEAKKAPWEPFHPDCDVREERKQEANNDRS